MKPRLRTCPLEYPVERRSRRDHARAAQRSAEQMAEVPAIARHQQIGPGVDGGGENRRVLERQSFGPHPFDQGGRRFTDYSGLRKRIFEAALKSGRLVFTRKPAPRWPEILGGGASS